MTADLLIRTAEFLEQQASIIAQSYTVPPAFSDWVGADDEKAEHDTMMGLAAELRAAAPPEVVPVLPIPVEAALGIARDYGYDQVVIVARRVGQEGREHCTTYGRGNDHSNVAARIGEFLTTKVMGWRAEHVMTHERPAETGQ